MRNSSIKYFVPDVQMYGFQAERIVFFFQISQRTTKLSVGLTLFGNYLD